jgi:hypothetical protein
VNFGVARYASRTWEKTAEIHLPLSAIIVNARLEASSGDEQFKSKNPKKQGRIAESSDTE